MTSLSVAAERASALLSVLKSVARPEALAWLQSNGGGTRPLPTRTGFATAYAGAARRFPGLAASLPGDELERLRGAGIEAPEVWALADVVRALQLLRAVEAVPPSEGVALATEIFRRGDSAERIALLRGLPLVPEPEGYVALAVEACRTHVLDVFAAIACENPLPAAHFPELNFNQLVIKAIFMELPLERVVGWRRRANSELRRIAADYAAERRAAGRSVPADLALIQRTGEPT